MATRMGWFDVPLGAETRQLVANAQEAVNWINASFGKPLKYYNSAADMRDIWRVILTNGIIPEVRQAKETTIIPETQLGNSFSTTLLSGLRVQVNPGIGWIDGAYCIVDMPVELTVVAGAVNDIVLRLDMSQSDITFGLAVKTRSVASIAEGLTRAGGVYELGLHTVTVPSGETAVTSSMIEDHRLDLTPGSDGKPCCGLCGSLLQPDISQMYDRARSALQAVLDSATPPDGNLASGIYITDPGQNYAGNNVEDALEEVAQRFSGAIYEIANKDVTIPASAWSYNAAEMRHEATITDAAIKASTDVKLSVPDDRNGKVVLGALRPAAGHIVVYTTDANTAAQSLTLRMAVTEVRRTEVAE